MVNLKITSTKTGDFMDYGFIRVAAAVPGLRVADCAYNAEKIIELIARAYEKESQIVVFPELCISAYTCGDLFHQEMLLEECLTQLERIISETRDKNIVSIVGLPIRADSQIFNCAAVILKGEILGIVPKAYIPGYSEFYEERWFAPGSKALTSSIRLLGRQAAFGTDLLFRDENDGGICFGIEICEDLWVPVPPSSYQAVCGASILFNLSASNEVIGKYEYRRQLVRQQSARCFAGYVYTSAGIYESTTDVVFGGHALISEYGTILSESERFCDEDQLICAEIDVQRLLNDRCKNTSFMELQQKPDYRFIDFKLRDLDLERLERAVDALPFVPSSPEKRDERCSEIFSIQTSGLAKRYRHTAAQYAVIGISGGLDSTLALLVTVKTFDMLGLPRKNIIAVTMPGFGTTNATYNNSIELMDTMGVGIREVDIRPACLQHFKDIGHDAEILDITYENVQARERTQILMDMANKIGGLVIGTGDLSELALGWCTYNGDHMSMYAVNCSIPKTLVKFLVLWAAENVVDERTSNVLRKVLDTPISPELLPPDKSGEIKQKTEDIVGPYELHDFFLYHMMRYGAPPLKILFLAEQAFGNSYRPEVIKKWLKVFYKRFFSQQFKRSCLPDGPKVGTISLSPRGDWRMPSDACAEVWLRQLD
ncbi:NAD+ synthase (glutamine-hydrolysing) [Anaerobacterium chartisolvens]|uniref:Glutamine-dependent NAD(+) synthetase n=2 Tax=Anaerobacterium chartisolvens TaxID=1297424 RepID=A0A369B7K0_9FIRM|nr:NAD+ synthase (glutamine-hydrolysing) [Anaerobacterium chartisolvens]